MCWGELCPSHFAMRFIPGEHPALPGVPAGAQHIAAVLLPAWGQPFCGGVCRLPARCAAIWAWLPPVPGRQLRSARLVPPAFLVLAGILYFGVRFFVFACPFCSAQYCYCWHGVWPSCLAPCLERFCPACAARPWLWALAAAPAPSQSVLPSLRPSLSPPTFAIYRCSKATSHNSRLTA